MDRLVMCAAPSLSALLRIVGALEACVMRTILYAGLMTMALLLHPGVSGGDDHSHRQAAETLLLVLGVDKSLPQIATHMLDNQLKQHPQLTPQREVLQRFLTTYGRASRRTRLAVLCQEGWPLRQQDWPFGLQETKIVQRKVFKEEDAGLDNRII